MTSKWISLSVGHQQLPRLLQPTCLIIPSIQNGKRPVAYVSLRTLKMKGNPC